MRKLSKAINALKILATIPNYPKCKKCGNADPYIDENGLCYKCFELIKEKPIPKTIPSPSYPDDDEFLDSIIKNNDLIPYLKTRSNYMCILYPFHLIPVDKVSISNAQSVLNKADPKLMEKIIDNAALSGVSDVNDEIRRYCVEWDVMPQNNNLIITLTPAINYNNILMKYQISKNDLAPIIASDDLNKIGVPKWFIRSFKHMSTANPVNFLKGI